MHQGLTTCGGAVGCDAQELQEPFQPAQSGCGLSARDRLNCPNLFGGERKVPAVQILFHVLGV